LPGPNLGGLQEIRVRKILNSSRLSTSGLTPRFSGISVIVCG
jgi:hypothetical protein